MVKNVYIYIKKRIVLYYSGYDSIIQMVRVLIKIYLFKSARSNTRLDYE